MGQIKISDKMTGANPSAPTITGKTNAQKAPIENEDCH